MTQPTHSEPSAPPRGPVSPPGRPPRGPARTFTVLGLVVGGIGLVLGLACLAAGVGDGDGSRLLAGAGFILGGAAAGAALLAAGWLAGQMERVSMELRVIARRVDARVPAPSAPSGPETAPAQPEPPGGHEAVIEAIEQLRAEILLPDEQRRERAARAAAARIGEMAALAGEELADGRLDAAEARLAELGVAGAGEEQLSPLRAQLAAAAVKQAEESIVSGQLEQARRCMDQIARLAPDHAQLGTLRERVLTFFAERADRAVLAGDFRRAEDWIDELAQARPDDPRIVELRSRMQRAQAGAVAMEFTKQKKYVEDMLAVAEYDRAEAAVDSMVERLGLTEEIQAFAALVKGEAAAFREEQRRRMLAEVRQYAEGRQWRKALDAARELSAEHPQSHQAEEVRGMLLLLEENARIEEVRQLRDRIADLIERKRFAEAVEVAEDVIHRFPDTQAAGQLAREIDKLRKRAGMNDLL